MRWDEHATNEIRDGYSTCVTADPKHIGSIKVVDQIELAHPIV